MNGFDFFNQMTDLSARIDIEEHGSFEPEYETEQPHIKYEPMEWIDLIPYHQGIKSNDENK